MLRSLGVPRDRVNRNLRIRVRQCVLASGWPGTHHPGFRCAASGASVSCRERRLSLKRCEKKRGGASSSLILPVRVRACTEGVLHRRFERRQQPAMWGIQLTSDEGVRDARSGGGTLALTSSQAPSPAEALEGSFLSLPRSSVLESFFPKQTLGKNSRENIVYICTKSLFSLCGISKQTLRRETPREETRVSRGEAQGVARCLKQARR